MNLLKINLFGIALLLLAVVLLSLSSHATSNCNHDVSVTKIITYQDLRPYEELKQWCKPYILEVLCDKNQQENCLTVRRDCDDRVQRLVDVVWSEEYLGYNRLKLVCVYRGAEY